MNNDKRRNVGTVLSPAYSFSFVKKFSKDHFSIQNNYNKLFLLTAELTGHRVQLVLLVPVLVCLFCQIIPNFTCERATQSNAELFGTLSLNIERLLLFNFFST